jgi:Transposase DNA-binding
MDVASITRASFGEEFFATASLGDRRRTRRLVQLADQLVQHPEGTLPDKLPDPAALKAAYRLMDADDVTHAAVLEPARQRVLELLVAASGPVLLVHDGTELDYTGLTSLTQLGRIGNGSHRGYLCHNVLAVEAGSRAVLGLVHQELAKRPVRPRRESRQQRRDKPDRESRLWKRATQAIPTVAASQVELADRGGDVLEFLDAMAAAGKSYLVRSRHNRRVELSDGTKTKLHDFARALPAGGTRSFEVPACEGRPARMAVLSVSFAAVQLRVPVQPRGEIRGVPLQVWVVRVWEAAPPAGAAALEWVLLTNVAVADAAAAWERVDWYAVRWVIEEYHKGLKTGCGVEELQFTTEERLRPMIALLSVVAVFLLRLRSMARGADAAKTPARALFSAEAVEALSLWRHGEAWRSWSVAEFCLALARLGGHQNRRGDGLPGWQVLWRGWMKLQLMAEAITLRDEQKCG